ncbi:MAG: alpha/beta fold hydrolase [Candidatus Dormibacteria bacterium]
MNRLTADLRGPLVYADFGGAGKPGALLLHGIGGSKINWQLFAPLLSAQFHTLGLDLPGFGESPLAGRSAGLDAQRDLVIEFIERFMDPPVLLVGHSMGGLISTMVGAARPDLLRGLVLFAPAFPPTESPAPSLPSALLDRASYAPRISGTLGQLMVRARGAHAVVTETLRNSSADFDALPPGFVQSHVDAEEERMRKPGAYIGYMQGWRWFHSTFREPAGLEGVISSITVPAILLQGTLDGVVLPAAGHRLAQLQPGWTAHFMEGIGHNPNFEAPAESMAFVAAWLQEIAPT